MAFDLVHVSYDNGKDEMITFLWPSYLIQYFSLPRACNPLISYHHSPLRPNYYKTEDKGVSRNSSDSVFLESRVR